VKNPTEAITITDKQSTPSKLSPENNTDMNAPSPVKIKDKPFSVFSEKQFSESCNIRNGSNRGSQEGNLNGNTKRMVNGNTMNSPINGHTSTNRNGYRRYTPPCENGSRYVRHTPTKEDQQRPRRNSSK
jgi:hypothetical protein